MIPWSLFSFEYRDIQLKDMKRWLGKERIEQLSDEEKAYLEEFTG